ncbi:MAG TPA: nuclear transport factor 2 family protein [Acidobacteriaceae bacterium]|jgi:uncharacterized protein (TIGR02246 family)|nr:nuclear transport factor 2 family protein [Acidobacteriaceae bacterium]
MRKMSAWRFLAVAITVAVLGLSILPAATAQAGAQAGETGDKAEIRAVIAKQVAAWNKGDIESFMKGYEDSPETTFVGSLTVNKGYGQVLDRYKKNYATRALMGMLTFHDLEVRLLPSSSGKTEYALVTGHFHLDRTERGKTGKDDGIFSLVFHKTADGWKIVLDHTA